MNRNQRIDLVITRDAIARYSFDESKHARDHGKFSSDNGGEYSQAKHLSELAESHTAAAENMHNKFMSKSTIENKRTAINAHQGAASLHGLAADAHGATGNIGAQEHHKTMTKEHGRKIKYLNKARTYHIPSSTSATKGDQ